MKRQTLFVVLWLSVIFVNAQTLSFTINADSLFVNDTLITTNTSTGFPAGAMFIWNFGDSCVNLPTGNPAQVIPAGGTICNDTVVGTGSVIYRYKGAGKYIITLSCYDTLNNCANSVTHTIVVHSRPYTPAGMVCELVINGDFEDYDQSFCPINFTTTNYLGAGNYSSNHTGAVFSWTYPTGGSPDYFVQDITCSNNNAINNFAGCEAAQSGIAYTGLQVYAASTVYGESYREYVQGELVQPLIAGRTYFLSLYVSLADRTLTSCNFQVSFNQTQIIASNNVTQFPAGLIPPAQIVNFGNNYGNQGWTHFTATYTAQGGERFIQIGNSLLDVFSNPFTNQANSNCVAPTNIFGYIYLDNVSLYGIQAEAEITHVCNGALGAIDLTSFCGAATVTYLWSNGATTEDITGISAGTYTVTITDANGAQSTFEYVIQAISSPIPPSISGPVSPCFNGWGNPLDYEILNPEAGVTYTWSVPGGNPSSGTGTQFTTSFSANGSYTITVTASNGCSSTGTFEIHPCCEPETGGDELTNTSVSIIYAAINSNPSAFNFGSIFGNSVLFDANYSHLISGNAAVPDFSAPVEIAINGTLNVDADLVFHDCRIYLGPDARLVLAPNVDLIIEHCLITSCGEYMWDQMIASDASNRIMIQAVRMEDAQKGIISENGADLLIPYNYFNKNKVSIQLHNLPSGTHPARIYGNYFNCIGQSGNPENLLRPFSGDFALTGIDQRSVNNLLIGDASQLPNHFKNLTYGIYSDNCSGIIINNDFQFMQPYNNHCSDCGTGIYATGAGYPATHLTIGLVTSTFGNFYNWFSDSRFGIVVTRDVNTRIYANDFTNMEQTGVYTHDTRISINTISVNQFETFNNGVSVYNPLSSTSSFIISNNEFTNTGYPATGNPFYSTAINIQNINGRPACVITRNIINDCRLGIHASNVMKPPLNIGFDTPTPGGNSINFNVGNASSVQDEHIGIWLQNCSNARVVDNTITNNQPADGNPYFKGIDVERSLNARINCNRITNLSYSMRFLSNCDGTLLRANEMTEYDVAVWLDGAILPDQYQLDNTWGTEEPLDNEWYDAGGSNRVDGTTASGNPINWNWNQTNAAVYKPDPANFAIVFPLSDFAGTVTCDDFSNRQEREERLGDVVRDNLEFEDYESENIYLAKTAAFLVLHNDSSLLNAGDTADYVFQQFYSDMLNSNIGLFNEVNELAADSSNVSLAVVLNAAITDTNSIEYFSKTVNDIYLSKSAEGIPLSVTDSLILENIAYGNVVTTGEAHFVAAAMLGLEVHPAYNALRKKRIEKDKGKSDAETIEIVILPNPANEYISVKGLSGIQEVEILSTDGKLIKKFAGHQNQYAVRELERGYYFIRISDFYQSKLYRKLQIVR